MSVKNVAISSIAVSLSALSSLSATTIFYSDNFDDNTNTGWTYIDRASAGTGTAGGPGDPSFAEQNGQLEQTSTNYDFATYTLTNNPAGSANALGSLALSGSGSLSGVYSISASLDSLENSNDFQDQGVVFGYVDQDNFWFVHTVNTNSGSPSMRLYQVAGANLTQVGATALSSFSHAPTALIVDVNTVTGTVSASYDGDSSVELGTGLTIAAGLNGVGSNNDAFAVDNYVITIPEPSALVLGALGSLLILCRKR